MKVITFSRNFPTTHPRKGEPTYFVEKIFRSFITYEHLTSSDQNDFADYYCELISDLELTGLDYYPKHHTIRAGERWKVGDWFSPRIWSGKPYASKQIQFAPPIQIKKIWPVEIKISVECFEIGIPTTAKDYSFQLPIDEVSKNDGLSIDDFKNWFLIHPKKKELFQGQILCWNDSIEYLKNFA